MLNNRHLMMGSVVATKAELEIEYKSFHSLAEQTKASISAHEYSAAIALGLKSFEFIDGMIQYERKYEDKENPSHPTIKAVLTFAPVVFGWKAIDEVEALLNSTRRIEKNSNEDWRQRIADSRQLQKRALHLWSSMLSQETYLPEAIEVSRKDRQFILKSWEEMGFTTTSGSVAENVLVLASSKMERTRAKCMHCGEVAVSTKEKFLSEVKCPRCSMLTLFVMLGSAVKKG